MYIKIVNLYVKVIGFGGDKIIVNSYIDFVDTIKKLQISNKPLTFAFGLEYGHHCTISYINWCNNQELFIKAKLFFDTIHTNPINELKILSKTKFNNKTDVFVLEIQSDLIYNVFQQLSQCGKQEGPSLIRTPHMTWFLNGNKEKIIFLQNILDSIELKIS